MKLIPRQVDYPTAKGNRALTIYHLDVRGSTWNWDEYRKLVRQGGKQKTTEIMTVEAL